MAVIKKVVAMMGEEYQKLKEKAQAYDKLMREQDTADTLEETLIIDDQQISVWDEE